MERTGEETLKPILCTHMSFSPHTPAAPARLLILCGVRAQLLLFEFGSRTARQRGTSGTRIGATLPRQQLPLSLLLLLREGRLLAYRALLRPPSVTHTDER